MFLTRDGWGKILDFGLAKLTYQESAAGDNASVAILSSLTKPGTIIGTVGDMTPEQVRGAAVDRRSDLFTLRSGRPVQCHRDRPDVLGGDSVVAGSGLEQLRDSETS